MSQNFVDQNHARILREALARISRVGPPAVQRVALQALAEYAAYVAPTCSCSERVFVAKEGREACLDCGQRHRPTSADARQLAFVEIVGEPHGNS
jgi:hypothetical protein